MGFIFGNEIILNNEIEDFIKCVRNTKWFINCSNTYSKKLYYKFIFEEDIKSASKHLIQENHANFKNIESLFSQADSRLNWFLNRNYDEKQTVRNKLIDIVNKRFLKNKNPEIDFDYIEKEYCKIFLIDKPRYNWFSWMFMNIINEMYFKNYVQHIPTFYIKIFEIFNDGHIITGWKGKFPPQHLCLDTEIDNKDGELIVF